MSKVLFDTNIWVDIVLDRPQFASASKGAIMACLEDSDDALVAATSLKDIFYFAAKSAGAAAGYRAIELILSIAKLAQVDEIVCTRALDLEQPDYEDGIVAACALAEQADVIVSRDGTAFNDLGVAKYTPDAYLAACGYRPIDW